MWVGSAKGTGTAYWPHNVGRWARGVKPPVTANNGRWHATTPSAPARRIAVESRRSVGLPVGGGFGAARARPGLVALQEVVQRLAAFGAKPLTRHAKILDAIETERA